mgnify:CR=1 FL=1
MTQQQNDRSPLAPTVSDGVYRDVKRAFALPARGDG